MWNVDWEQYRKNLELERNQWIEFERRREFLKEQMLERIAKLEAEKEKIKDECRRRIKWAHRAYMRNVEKKFKTSIRV
jgi:hypothetical protein